MVGKVLVYNFSEERLKKLKQFFLLSNILIQPVLPKDFSASIGYLAGEKGFVSPKKIGKSEFSEELFVMCGFTEDEMKLILDILKQNQFIIPLKAVLTKVNAFWSGNQLYKALKTEQIQIKK